MRIAHLADLHLGWRIGQTDAMADTREADVLRAFASAVDQVIAAKPDVVVIAGDLFHTPRPTNPAMLAAVEGLQRLRQGLPQVPVILIAGNHDFPKSTAAGCVLPVFREFGVDVVVNAQRLEYPHLDLSVMAVGDGALRHERPSFEPEGMAKHQILVIHGDVPESTRKWAANVEHGAAALTLPELSSKWSGVMMGDYHTQREIAPRVWYAGSLDFVCSNPWPETQVPKGWLLWDLEAGTVTPQAIPLSREFVDLPSIDAEGLAAAEVDGLIASAFEQVPGDSVVRLVIRNIGRDTQRLLDHQAIRKSRGRFLGLTLDMRKPEAPPRSVGMISIGSFGPQQQEEECWDLSEFGLDTGKEPAGGWPGSGDYSIADGLAPLPALVMEGDLDDYCGQPRQPAVLTEGETFDLPEHTGLVEKVEVAA